jgi:Domain of unknown function (DUF4397)
MKELKLKTFLFRALGAAILLISTVLAAQSPAAAQPVNGAAVAFVDVLHASPDAPPVDVYANGKRVIRKLAYGFDRLVRIPAGDAQVQVFVAGANPKKDKPVISATIPLEPETYYVVAAVNTVDKIEALVIPPPKLPQAGNALLRIVNIDPTGPAVDLIDSGDSNKVIIDNVAFKDIKTAEIKAGAYMLDFVEHGTTNIIGAPSGSLNFVDGGFYEAYFFPSATNANAKSTNNAAKPKVVIKRVTVVKK